MFAPCSARWARLLAMSLAVIAAGEVRAGDPPTPASPGKDVRPAKARTDAEGIPLPEGALARLGSSRFRYAGINIVSVAFSPDGRHLAATHSGGVAVFDVATGRTLHKFGVPEKHSPKFVRFLADGKRVAIGSRGKEAAELTLYSFNDGKPLATTKFDGKGQVSVVDITSDGLQVLVDDLWGRGIFLWDLKAGKEVWLFEVSEVAFPGRFTPDGKWLGVAYRRKVELRDAATGKVVSVYPDPGPGFRELFNATIAPDGRAAVGGVTGGELAILDPKGPVSVRMFAANPGLNQRLFSPDVRYLVGVGISETQVWDLTAKDDQRPVARMPGAWGGAFSQDGKTLALDGGGFLTLWTVGDWKALPQSADPAAQIYPVRFTHDGKRVLGHTRSGWLSWPAGGGKPTRLADDSAVRHMQLGMVNGYQENADVSADGRVAVESVYEPEPVANQGKVSFRVTDLMTGVTRSVPRDAASWHSPQLSPDGRFVTADVGGQAFAVWDLTSGKLLHRLPRLADGIYFTATAATDGKGFAHSVSAVWNRAQAGRFDGPRYRSVTVTDHQAGRAWTMDPMPNGISVARFSPDASLMMLQGDFEYRTGQDYVSVWEVRTGRRLLNWPRGHGRPGSVAVSADNRSLIVGDLTGRLSVIEIATGQERVAFHHAGEIISAAFHPDGSKLVASSPEAPVYVWDLLADAGRWDAARAEGVWADLVSPDAKAAFVAVRKLRANPTDAVTFLKERVKVPTVPADERVAQWLKDMEAPRFAVRELAQRELTTVADLIRPQLEAARKSASEEAGRRLEQILKAGEALSTENLRQLRACEVLEGIRTPDAIRLLQTWAAGPAGTKLTTEAQQSIGRIKP